MNPLIQAFKETATFLGKKLDKVIEALHSQTIKIDIGESGKALQDAADTLAATTKLIATNEKSRDFTDVRNQLVKQADQITRATSALIQALGKIERTEKLLPAVRGLERAIKSIKLEVKPTDLTPLSRQLTRVQEELAGIRTQLATLDNRQIATAIEKLATAFGKIQMPTKMSLDDNQVRAITYGGGVGGGGVKTATGVTISRVSMASANTEYSYAFPSNTVAWAVKLESQNTRLLYAFETGKLPSSGDGTAYVTAPQNFIQSKENVEWTGKTIYLQSSGTSQTAEIVVYTM